ncbi:MAG: pseudoazurin [Colwellia sp.]|nr:MAG: pseudoazurin [Colwellia sp.]
MTKLTIFSLCLLLCSSVVNAKEHIVNLKTTGNNGKMMVFEPMLLQISVGDTVNFIPSDTSHNAVSFSVPSDKSTFNTPYGKATKITFSEKGVVLVKCLPHFVMGMIGVIQVGDDVDKTKALADWNAIKDGVAMNKEAVDKALAKIK